MLVRTQIQLESAEHSRIKSFAARRGLSMSAAIRMLIRRGLGEEEGPGREAWERLLEFAGSGQEPDGARDVAQKHDHYLYGRPE